MYNLLKGKKGIIFGASDENSIAWKTAKYVHEEGGKFVLTNAPVAMHMGQMKNLAEKTGSGIIPADATNVDGLENLITKSVETLGGKLDLVLYSIGMSVNVCKNIPYTESNYTSTEKGWDISALSFHKLCQALYKNDAVNEWGSIVALAYMAAQRTSPDCNDMADNKACLEPIARSFGYFSGKDKKVCVNTTSQSPIPTTAEQGVKGSGGFIAYADVMSPSGNAMALDYANYTASLFSDLTCKVTMQNLYHDGGFSGTGVSNEVIERLS